jgi:hypothetical protein
MLKQTIFAAAAAAVLLAGASGANAGPMCSALTVSLNSLEYSVAKGDNNLANLQGALNDAVTNPPALIGQGSFSPGPDTGMEFSGTRLADGFDATLNF